MKKVYIIMLLFAAAFSSCKKENSSAFEVEPVHPDPEKLLQQLVTALDQGASGWEAVLNPKSGKSYSMFFSMDGKGQVFTLADLDPGTAREPKVGTYRLHKGVTNASISFSAGTYLDDITHKKGFRTLSADTSYSFKYQKGDTLVLLGNQYGDELKMISITADQVIAYERGVLGNSYIYMNNYFSKMPFFSVTAPGNIHVQVGINARNRSLNLIYASEGKLVVNSTDYSYGLNRIIFKTPIRIGQLWVRELLIDTTTGAFYITNGTGRIALVGSSMPVLPLHLLIGRDFPPVISLPSPVFMEELPGWSPAFTDIWFESTLNMYNSDLNSQLMLMAFNLDDKNKKMNLDFFFTFNDQVYIATFPLSYTKTIDGIYKFEAGIFDPNESTHENAKLILPHVSPILSVIVSDSFDMDYYDTGTMLIAQMKSRTHPDIYFTGYLQSYR